MLMYVMIKYNVPYWIIYTRFITSVFILLYLGLSITTSFRWSGGGGEVGRRGQLNVRDGGGCISNFLQHDI